MNPVELITRKRDGEELSKGELEFLISGYVKGRIPDYQISSLLMAIYFKGMTPGETATLTRTMRDSGTVLDLSHISSFKADKHSTGGVGDKVSLILAPLVASAGLVIPMISGRSLAHTGGTLDKLEAIPGFRTDLSISEIDAQLDRIGVALVGQTTNLCPADKKIYALRDATGTVNAIPLITASILSKKMAEGIDGLVLDVKAGSGAIFEDEEKAWELARMLVSTAKLFDLRTVAVITSMQQPLGHAIGNWLETREAIGTLKGEGPEDLVEITLTLGAEMLMLGNVTRSRAEARDLLGEKLASGAAFERFLEITRLQGGDLSVIEDPSSYEAAKYSHDITSPKSGFVAEIHCREIGIVSMDLGAGRTAVADSVDYTSGIMLRKKVGESVVAGELLAIAYSNSKDSLTGGKKRLQNAFVISGQHAEPSTLICGLIDLDGVKVWNAESRDFRERRDSH